MRAVSRAIVFRTRAVFGRSSIVPLGDSSRLKADLGSTASILVAYANPPDYEEWLVWKRHLRSGDLFVDVGANVGIYSILMAERGCRVLAFEPDSSNAQRMLENLDLNQLRGRVEIRTEVVSDVDGPVAFSIGHDAESRLVSAGEGCFTTLESVTLDTAVQGEVRGIKIDVEGAEESVLRGAVRILTESNSLLLQIEWNDRSRLHFNRHREYVGALLEEYGYQTFRPDAQGQLVRCDWAEGRDVFAARPGHA